MSELQEKPVQPALGRIIIYTQRMPEMIAFYAKHFGFRPIEHPRDRIVELSPPAGGATILLHPASKGQKEGQALVKLVFDVADVKGFCLASAKRGLEFGPIHRGENYEFANAKDPCNNSVSISSRAFAGRPHSGKR